MQTRVHTSTAQWQARTDTLASAPGFWNNTTNAFSNELTSSNTAITPASFNMAAAAMEPPRDAQSGATLRRGRPPDTARQPAFWYCIDLAFGYLQSGKFQSARPPDDKQSPKPSGRPGHQTVADDERSHKLRSCSLKTLEGQPCGASTKTAQTQDTDGRGGNKEFTPGARTRVGIFAGRSVLCATQPDSAGRHCCTGRGCH